MDYHGIDESYNTDAENVIADYDDYPQYDYDGDYEEELTGSGGPDYGQYYDYDYDSRNQDSSGRDLNDGNEIYENEEESLANLEENVDSETLNERSFEESRGQGEPIENEATEETSNHEISSTTSTTITTSKATTTTKSITTTSLPKPTEATTVSTFYKTFFVFLIAFLYIIV